MNIKEMSYFKILTQIKTSLHSAFSNYYKEFCILQNIYKYSAVVLKDMNKIHPGTAFVR